jgi:hypothetical protein
MHNMLAWYNQELGKLKATIYLLVCNAQVTWHVCTNLVPTSGSTRLVPLADRSSQLADGQQLLPASRHQPLRQPLLPAGERNATN